MGLDARRDAGFPRNCMMTYSEEGNQGPTKQPGPFRKPQENACETCRLTDHLHRFTQARVM
jgi:hypothetical protein